MNSLSEEFLLEFIPIEKKGTTESARVVSPENVLIHLNPFALRTAKADRVQRLSATGLTEGEIPNRSLSVLHNYINITQDIV